MSYTPSKEIDYDKELVYKADDLFALREMVDRIRDIAFDFDAMGDEVEEIIELCDKLMGEIYDPEIHAVKEAYGYKCLDCDKAGETTENSPKCPKCRGENLV